jgi:DNA polymerase (family 10)
VDIVAACRTDPLGVASSIARIAGVSGVDRDGTTSPGIRFADGMRLDLFCVSERDFAVGWWRATGSADHVAAIARRLADRGIAPNVDSMTTNDGHPVEIRSEEQLYGLAAMPFVPPELREGNREFVLADRGPFPSFIQLSDVRGALHAHTTWSDGKQSIAQMAAGAQERGWSYLGITDHSQGAFYAGGLSRERVLAQLEEIDRLNAGFSDFRILKGIECDILADGTLDYDADLLGQLDFVVGSIHSRFSMDRGTMTTRILRALDDPRLTILGHPTGRLLLSRRPAAMDIEAIIEKACARRVAIELNCDPKRMDLDWRLIPQALDAGCTIAIGPDAHSVKALDNVALGVGAARKAGVTPAQVLNTRDIEGILAFARRR